MVTSITVAESAAFLNFFLAGLLLFCCGGLNTFLRSSLTSQTAQDDLQKCAQAESEMPGSKGRLAFPKIRRNIYSHSKSRFG